ncbi:helix-turn-helix domain-containing protein [Micromonospora sp. DT62]|uniref:helix-turn-helix domain-containing protein n=1 Tax=Micromonospora sp. DT62 TaxID=3416521 RepID=UPI003CF13057
MVTIEVGAEALGGIRLAGSPLWETIGSLVLLGRHRDEVPWPYGAWARRCRIDPEVMALAGSLASVSPPLPSFLTPPPRPGISDIAEELDRLRTVPPAEIEADAGELPAADPFVRQFARDPERCRDRYADLLQAHWETNLGEVWGAMRTLVEEEALTRGQCLVTDGPRRVLGTLHDRIRWQDDTTLTVAGGPEQAFTAVAEQMVIVPLTFGRHAAMFFVHDPRRVVIAYQVRGASVLSLAQEPRRPVEHPAGDPLGLLIGHSRAALMRAVEVAASTTALAARLGLAASTVSQHLSTLMASGMVDRRRQGNRVLYQASPLGAALVREATGPGGPGGRAAGQV